MILNVYPYHYQSSIYNRIMKLSNVKEQYKGANLELHVIKSLFNKKIIHNLYIKIFKNLYMKIQKKYINTIEFI